eukprot:gene25322-29783_t
MLSNAVSIGSSPGSSTDDGGVIASRVREQTARRQLLGIGIVSALALLIALIALTESNKQTNVAANSNLTTLAIENSSTAATATNQGLLSTIVTLEARLDDQAALIVSLPGVTTFAGDIYIRGTNVKASVVNELLKDVNTVGGIVHCHGGGGSMSGTSVSNEQAYFAPGDDQLVFASLTNVTDINIYFNKVRNSAGQYSGPSAASFPELRHLAGTVRMYWNEKLKTISMPKLVGVGGGIRIYSNNVLTTVDIQSLVSVGDDLSLNSNNILPTLVMQSLVSVGGEFNLRSSPLLTTTGVTVSKEFTFLGYMFVAPDS